MLKDFFVIFVSVDAESTPTPKTKNGFNKWWVTNTIQIFHELFI
jgi:hypothetical protein